MNLTPEDIIVSFLHQAQQMKIGAVVFAGFEREGKLMLRSNHTFKDDAVKAGFVFKFMSFDDRAIEAGAAVLHKALKPTEVWEDLPELERKTFLEATRAALSIAIAVATTNSETPAVDQKPPIQ